MSLKRLDHDDSSLASCTFAAVIGEDLRSLSADFPRGVICRGVERRLLFDIDLAIDDEPFSFGVIGALYLLINGLVS
jgi:hypothetical protein